MKNRQKYGFTLIEILLILGLSALILPPLFAGLMSTRGGKVDQQKRIQALELLKEATEAARSYRENDWTQFAVNGTYHPVIVNNTWTLATGSEVINGFTREIDISSVQRSGGAIVETGGTQDPSTKKLVSTVSWTNPTAGSVTSTQYITRYLDNVSYTQTTQADFNPGIKTNVSVTNTAGGEVMLSAGSNGDWCRPNDFIRTELNLPGNAAATDVKAYEGKAFTGTNQTSSGSFIEINVGNSNPPTAVIDSQINGYQTNDVFISGNYAYVATNDPNKDVVIIDLTTNSEVGYYNGSNSWPYNFGNAEGVFVVGDTGYVTIGLFLHSFNLSAKTGSRPVRDTVFLWGTGYRLYIVGNHAYIAVDFGSAELRLVNIANPSNMSLGAKANVNGTRGQEVFVNSTGTRAYLATTADNSRDEFFVINTNVSTSQKNNSNTNLSVIDSYDASGMDPKGVTLVTGNKAILVGAGAEEYQVIDITNENNITRCGGTQVDSGIFGVGSVLEADGDAYSYIVTGDINNEFKIIEGGVGGGLFSSPGTFLSAVIDSDSATLGNVAQAVFNRFSATYTLPDQTDIQFQFAGADPVNGSCNGAVYDFVGPDGTSGSYFTTATALAIPLHDDGTGYENPARCAKYKVVLTTLDNTSSPVFNDITINYVP